MDKKKKKALEAKGFEITTVAEFLGLTPGEEAVIELRLKLSKALKDCRQRAELTQTEAARQVKTSQSRLAKMEAGDKSVSLDLLVGTLFNLGFDKKEFAKVVK